MNPVNQRLVNQGIAKTYLRQYPPPLLGRCNVNRLELYTIALGLAEFNGSTYKVSEVTGLSIRKIQYSLKEMRKQVSIFLRNP